MNDKTKFLEQKVMIASRMLKMLSNQNRLRILCSLAKGEKTVSELLSILQISQSALSQHLTKMKNENILQSDKRGQMVYYYISNFEVEAIISILHLLYCRE
jgi:DNA-binding transcriptional ArsR family regulator